MIFTQVDRQNNMNVVRMYLCLCIIMNHFNVLNEASLPTLPRIFGGVGSFFAISGFLMFASFEKRQNVRSYFDRRLRRILPPYVLIVLLAAVALSLVSTLPAREYFTDPGLYKYVGANLLFLNFLDPDLPGVFVEGVNHLSAVNGSLWTMKGEVICYLAVPAVYALLRRHAHRAPQVLLALTVMSLAVYLWLSLSDDGTPRAIAGIVAKQFRLFAFFFFGAILNIYLAYVKRYKWWVLAAAVALLYVSTLDGVLHLSLRPFTDSVLVIWFCMIGKWGHCFSRYNSISYDMYLFHFPVIQVLIAVGAVDAAGLWPSLAIAVAVTVVMAALSWRYVGKRILNSKRLSIGRG